MTNLDDRIRMRAYDIWIEQGQPAGQEFAHWEQARRDVEDAERAETGGADSEERRLNEGLDESFPGSDPASESQPGGGITGPGRA